MTTDPPTNEMAASLKRDGFGADEIANMLGPDAEQQPVQLRWGLDDVMWGDDDSVTVLLSGPDGEPYWLELDQERAVVLRQNLAGPDCEQPAVPAVVAPATDRATPVDWINGHPKLEAIAAAVWERCGRSDSGICVEDDPRNIAVAALAAVLPASADRATVLRKAADRYQGFIDNADTGADPRYWTGIRDMVIGLRHLAAESVPAVAGRADNETHACGNCDGIDPDSCLTNPDRPPAGGAQQPKDTEAL